MGRGLMLRDFFARLAGRIKAQTSRSARSALSSKPVRIVSWNVNGLRACVRKGFLTWLARSRADVVAVQEVRSPVATLPENARQPRGWHTDFTEASRPGYSGVGLYSRQRPDSIEHSLGEDRFDREGRLQLARFGRLTLANGYFPNGSGRNRDNSRIPFKLAFYRRLHEMLDGELATGQRVLVVGDFNTAHQEIDLARPRENQETSGFTAAERRELDRWLRKGYVDTFRHFCTSAGRYSWWSNRPGIRERNVGWRLDYVLCSNNAHAFLRGAFIRDRVLGSDHCPVGVDVDPAILGG